MKSNVFIIHGAYDYPGENWFPWLKEELAEDLETGIALIEGAGHFNAKAGYLKFERLLKEINKRLAK